MKIALNQNVKLVFENEQGNSTDLFISTRLLVEKNIDDLYEMLEDDCCDSASCNNESQNFCDCPPQYEDYSLKFLEIPSAD
jgi:hypothetical protein